MFKYKLFSFIILTVATFSCGEEKENEKMLFPIDTSLLKQAYNPNESIELKVKNDENKKIDSIVFSLNDKKIGSIKGFDSFNYALTSEKLGYKKVKAIIYHEEKETTNESQFIIYAASEPKLLNYKIVNTYNHDSNSYTQGYEFYKGFLIEGSGQYGKSSLRKTNYLTGNVEEKIDLEKNYFGEGITVLNDKIYQLTWQEKTVFVYDANTFKLEKSFPYFKEIDGWGLTNDGTNLYMSDGTEKIYIVNPETFEMIDYISVYTNSNKIEAINELEWIDGKIWANLYERDTVIKIDPKTGAIENILNLSDLKSKVTKPLQNGEVLNGIAHNPKNNTILVTGKNWDKAFEIKIE